VGAWIEILNDFVKPTVFFIVAPYVGAWIEMERQEIANDLMFSRTLRGCVD